MFLDPVAKALSWFEKAVPDPTEQNINTQLGVHLEEVNEMLMVVKAQDFATQTHINCAKAALHTLAEHLKKTPGAVSIIEKDRVEYLDALCDQIVTAVGCAHMADLDILGGLIEVNRSNFSKFDDQGHPIFDDRRKVMKGPRYEKPQLAAFV